MSRVLIIGGYGNFGRYIARSLDGDPAIRLIIGGRSLVRAREFAAALASAEPAALDIHCGLLASFRSIRPDIVIHTTGPFQRQDYRVAEAAIAAGAHYLDLADARTFVASIQALDEKARSRNVLIVSGASSVPCLTAAVIDHYRPRFAQLETVDYGISAAQQTNRGLATMRSVLSYVGQPFETLRDGQLKRVFGWQNARSVLYPELGRRWFGDCDIPDLELFPARYPELHTIRFGAGHELGILQLGTWVLSWPARWRLIPPLDHFAPALMRIAFLLDRFGGSRSGFHMILSGKGHSGDPKTIRFFLIARSGHGPFIPCMPAILLARKLARGEIDRRGAMPCLDLITLDEYLAALKDLDISVIRDA